MLVPFCSPMLTAGHSSASREAHHTLQVGMQVTSSSSDEFAGVCAAVTPALPAKQATERQ
jgi:hypothetical protein